MGVDGISKADIFDEYFDDEKPKYNGKKPKYIIKNCPAFVLMRTATSGTYFNMCGDAKGHIKCADCTDCVMKRIVEKCKKYIENYNDKVFYDDDDVKILMGKVMLSQSILSELLDIEECE